MGINNIFRKFASKISQAAGTHWAFIVALAIIISWAVSGSRFGYSNTWQLFINTGTTIVTLLMVFIIQNTQNRDSKAIHLKLDELLKSITKARNQLVNIEELPDDVLDKMHDQFRKIQEEFSGKPDDKPVKKEKFQAIKELMTNFLEKPFDDNSR